MAGLKCPCGIALSNSSIPNDVEGISFNFWQKEFSPKFGRGFWECKECGRLAFNFPGIHDSTVKWYVPENGQPGDLI